MNEKGWIRILEAFIAVALIAGVLIFVMSRNIQSNKDDEIYRLQRIILEEAANDIEIRDAVLNNREEEVNASIGEKVPEEFEFYVRICEVEDVCGLPFYKEEKYADEIIITSTLEQYSPKKLRLFLWQRGK